MRISGKSFLICYPIFCAWGTNVMPFIILILRHMRSSFKGNIMETTMARKSLVIFFDSWHQICRMILYLLLIEQISHVMISLDIPVTSLELPFDYLKFKLGFFNSYSRKISAKAKSQYLCKLAALCNTMLVFFIMCISFNK